MGLLGASRGAMRCCVRAKQCAAVQEAQTLACSKGVVLRQSVSTIPWQLMPRLSSDLY